VATLTSVRPSRVNSVMEQAKRIEFLPVLLALTSAIPFVIGWSSAKVLRLVWLAVSFIAAGVIVGWREGWGN
jgi:hypothetical protein